MGIKTQKVLRLISKIILILVGVGLVGIAGYYVYKSIAFKPQNVVITNITDGSATVTWTTSSPMKGIVYVKKDKALLPGPLGIVGSAMAYDDRDVSDAQKACVDAFNKKASETKDSTFSVSGSNFDCENVKVTKTGSYYTHSVTMTNLDENSTYNFVVGDGIWSFKESVSTVKTFSVLDTASEPKPIFGKIISDDGLVSKDGLAYITFNDGSESKDSIVYSSTTNEDGGWYLDASNVRDTQGNVLELELTNDTFKLKGIYSNYGISGEERYILGYFNGAYPDVVVKKTEQVNSSAMENLVRGIYAKSTEETYKELKTNTTTKSTTTNTNTNTSTGTKTPTVTETKAKVAEICSKCVTYVSEENLQKIAAEKAEGGTSATLQALATSIGAGNAAKISAALSTNGTVNFTDIGLTKNFGNINALVGTGTVTVKPGEEANANVTYEGVSSGGGYGKVVVSPYCGDKICNNGETLGSCFTDCQVSTQEPGDTGGGTGNACTEDPNSDNCATYCVRHPDTATCKAISDPNSCTSTGCNGEGTDTSKVDCIAKVEYFNSGDISSCTITCNGGVVSLTNKNKCMKVAPTIEPTIISDNSGYQIREVPISATEIDPYILSVPRIRTLVNSSPAVLAAAKAVMTETESLSLPWPDKKPDEYMKICKATGGTATPIKDINSNKAKGATCDYPPVPAGLNIFKVANVYAADSSASVSYSYYLPELGMYSFEVDGTMLASEVSSGEETHLFYVETNGVIGFQMPVDPDNPTKDEDVLLSTNALELTFSQESTAQQYAIKKGINIISFNFVPVSTDAGAYTAKDVITQASTNGVEVQYISTFEGGRWNNGYSCSSGTCTGSNFTIVPGKGYLIYATQDGTVTIPGYNLTSSVPVAFSAGWNLVGVHGYTTAYTARSFIDSINKIEGLTANNVSWWPTSKSKYEGLQVEGSTEYGLDFSMSPNNGYFVKISKFAPTDTKCKSLIWNEGGSLNGTCGNTK